VGNRCAHSRRWHRRGQTSVAHTPRCVRSRR
jgi:hypothetical protein